MVGSALSRPLTMPTWARTVLTVGWPRRRDSSMTAVSVVCSNEKSTGMRRSSSKAVVSMGGMSSRRMSPPRAKVTAKKTRVQATIRPLWSRLQRRNRT